ncbi:MAG: hypothetical protein ISS57_12740 [Anaerolineales bacterium]|nr:hypothetical protein [Anaerolineales bacterium]
MVHVQIVDKATDDEWGFRNMEHIPNIGDDFTLFDDDGEVLLTGIVEERDWAMIPGENAATVIIIVAPSS